MKNIIFYAIILCLFIRCSTRQQHYLGTLENTKYVVSHEDSLKIDRSKTEIKKGAYCFEMENLAEFRGGTSAFRQSIYENFKLPKKAKSGENLVLVTIGKQNNLEKAQILKYTDEETKQTIEDLFKLKALDNWQSASLFLVPVKQQFEISIFIK
ncbi:MULTISPECIES: hypothetical protein [unclassified Chryseobacterium]|uniref:hypothetical protein n=1 Tax=unclassified Chryseobacterium TaxID=2593645 RepID=UPI0030194938